jgi:hypothetical protein
LVFDRPVGGQFWLKLIGGLVAFSLIVVIVLWLAGAAIAAWGFLGALIAFSALAIGFGWWYDRRRPPPLDRI